MAMGKPAPVQKMRRRYFNWIILCLFLIFFIIINAFRLSPISGERIEEVSSLAQKNEISVVNSSEKKTVSLECSTEGKEGYMDSAGILSIPMCFDRAYAFSEGIARVDVDLPNDDTGLKVGYINVRGEFTIPPEIELDQIVAIHRKSQFKDGLLPLREPQSKKIGYINMTGEFVISPQFEKANSFYEGLAGVCFAENECGYIDSMGKTVISPQFTDTGNFQHGVAVVTLPGQGDVESTLPIERINSVFGLIDRAGNYLVPSDIHKIHLFEALSELDNTDSPKELFSDEGLLSVRVSYSQTELTQLPKLPSDFSLSDVPYPYAEGGSWSAVLPELPPTDGIEGSLGYGKWGYVRKTGGYAIEPKYWSASEFEDGLATVTIAADDETYPEDVRGSWAIIDTFGNIVTVGSSRFKNQRYLSSSLERRFLVSEEFRLVKDFDGGLAVAEMKGPDGFTGRYGYINAKGEFAIQPVFDSAKPFRGNSFTVVGVKMKDTDEELFGLIDRKGDYLLYPQHRKTDILDYGLVSLYSKNEPNKRILFSPISERVLPFYAVGEFDSTGLIPVSGRVLDSFKIDERRMVQFRPI